MAADPVDTAIKNRWVDQDAATTITGGLHAGQMTPTGTLQPDPPYARFDPGTERPFLKTTKSEVVRRTVTFKVYDRTKELVEGHRSIIDGVMKYAPLVLPDQGGGPSDDGHVPEVKSGEATVAEEDDQLWSYTLEYIVTRRKPVNYNPA